MKYTVSSLTDPLTAMMAVLLMSQVLPALAFPLTEERVQSYPLESKRAQSYSPMLEQKRAPSRDGAPKRPEQFKSVEELNRYLTALTDYYNVLGRPRFGKRSDSLTAELTGDTRYNEVPLYPSAMESDIKSKLSLALLDLLISRDREHDSA